MLFRARLLLLTLLLVASPLAGQDNHLTVLRGGEIRGAVWGGFRGGEERYGVREEGGETVEELEALAFDLQVLNSAAIFPGTDVLGSAVQQILGDPGYTPTLGPSEAYFQMSQSSAVFQLELGLTNWLTLGVSVPVMQSRTEGDVGILPSVDANLGVNPAVGNASGVLSFAESVVAAAQALPAGLQDTWLPWAEAWTSAYGASAVFPLEGTTAGDALTTSVADFNSVLSANGIPQVSGVPPLATVAMDAATLREIQSRPGGPLAYLSLPHALLWSLGDIETELRIKLLEGPALASTGRPAFGLTALGGVRIPTGIGDEVIALIDIPMGEALWGFDAGLGGWIRSDRFGLSGYGRYGIGLPGEVQRRVAPNEAVYAPLGTLATVEQTPGDRIFLEVRPSWAVAAPLWIEGFYTFQGRGSDSFAFAGADALRLQDPVPASELIAQPGPRYPASVLDAETESQVHLAGAGLRYQAPEGGFPVEAWANVQYAVAGSGGHTLRELRLSFGARLTQRLWGRE